nr:nuclear transport factor 2 family protein [uncultured Flavobacterium sp.]
MSKNVEIVQSYFNALSNNDFDTVISLLSDDLIWHQPGKGKQSGTYKGKENVLTHLGNFAKWSNGTFAIDHVDYITENGQFVAASINFKAEKGTKSISMKGMDLLLIEGGKIKEVWLFSERINEEDDFWTIASNH